MIKTEAKAIAAQQRRVAEGKKGRAKAVRRWFKRTYGPAVEATTGLPEGLRGGLEANFEGCRGFEQTKREEGEA